MRCVKTGIKFQVPQFREDTFHGDMFFVNAFGIYLIRGVASGTSDQNPDIVLAPADDIFCIRSISKHFRDFFIQWNDHDLALDINEDPTIIIDDTRFF
jgi:hypothetical protein